MRRLIGIVAACVVAGTFGCGAGGGGSQPQDRATASSSRSATLVGSMAGVSPRAAGRVLFAEASATCPDVTVRIDGTPTSVEFGSGCDFFVADMPTGDVTVTVQIEDITGAVELAAVAEGDVAEIEVEASEGSLAIVVVRQAEPEHAVLPGLVTENWTSIHLTAGAHDRSVVVRGDRFTLTGEAGDGCSSAEGWATVKGRVDIDGDSAFFQNIRFEGPVTVRGDHAMFRNVCFGDDLIVVGDDPGTPDSTPPTNDGSRCPQIIDFEDLTPGASVEGPGTVHPHLAISTAHGSEKGVVVVAENREPSLYGAPNGGTEPIKNGCLGNPGRFFDDNGSVHGQGFGDLDRVHDYVFTFFDGKTASEFSVTMLDFGDNNPDGATEHRVRLVAYDAQGRTVEHVLSYPSDTGANPTSPTFGDLLDTGDACTAQPGEPGNVTLTVSGSDILRVELEMDSGPDPEITLDNLAFKLDRVDVGIDVKSTVNLKSPGVIPVAVLSDACFDVGDVDFATLRFGPDMAAPAHKGPHADPDCEGDDCQGDEHDGGCTDLDSEDDDAHFGDVDCDGHRDMIVHFRAQETGLEPGDKEACLTGKTIDGRRFGGCDSIRVAPAPDK